MKKSIILATKAETLSKGYQDAGELRSVYERLGSLSKVAGHYAVSKKLILTYMQRFGIERTGTKTKPLDIEYAASLLDQGWTLQRVADACNVHVSTVTERLRRAGVKTNRFHNGYIRTYHGYLLVRQPGHPRADAKGYVREQVLVMEAQLGRLLTDDETVHHINRQKDDNRPENLRLMRAQEHRSLHSREPRRDIDAAHAAQMLREGYTMGQVGAHLNVSHKTLIRKLREADLYTPLPKGGARRRKI